jgi:hypothetical protein
VRVAKRDRRWLSGETLSPVTLGHPSRHQFYIPWPPSLLPLLHSLPAGGARGRFRSPTLAPGVRLVCWTSPSCHQCHTPKPPSDLHSLASITLPPSISSPAGGARSRFRSPALAPGLRLVCFPYYKHELARRLICDVPAGTSLHSSFRLSGLRMGVGALALAMRTLGELALCRCRDLLHARQSARYCGKTPICRKLQPQVQRFLDSYAALRSRIYISGDFDSTTPCLSDLDGSL